MSIAEDIALTLDLWRRDRQCPPLRARVGARDIGKTTRCSSGGKLREWIAVFFDVSCGAIVVPIDKLQL